MLGSEYRRQFAYTPDGLILVRCCICFARGPGRQQAPNPVKEPGKMHTDCKNTPRRAHPLSRSLFMYMKITILRPSKEDTSTVPSLTRRCDAHRSVPSVRGTLPSLSHKKRCTLCTTFSRYVKRANGKAQHALRGFISILIIYRLSASSINKWINLKE